MHRRVQRPAGERRPDHHRGQPPGARRAGLPGHRRHVHRGAEDGWRLVAERVHEGGGRLWVQIMHCGRAAHPRVTDGRTTVAASAVKSAGTTWSPEGDLEFVTPRALKTVELPGRIGDYVQAAESAVRAGADGIVTALRQRPPAAPVPGRTHTHHPHRRVRRLDAGAGPARRRGGPGRATTASGPRGRGVHESRPSTSSAACRGRPVQETYRGADRRHLADMGLAYLHVLAAPADADAGLAIRQARSAVAGRADGRRRLRGDPSTWTGADARLVADGLAGRGGGTAGSSWPTRTCRERLRSAAPS